MKLEFRLLGDVEVLANGHPLELGGTRQRSVLALLVLQRNRAIATELLADRLWPDEQPLTAIKTIQVYISRIRRALGPDADRVTSSATGYRLAVADDELDAARFERGLRQAREALAAGSPHAALATLEEALSLWSGPAMGDLAGEQFARREADRLEELRLQALEELFELRIGTGSGRDAIGELRRLLADHPGRERLWRLLMLALYADGRQGESLAAYQDARRYLADELGVDPSPELQDLERAILTQEAPRPRPTPLGPTTIVGPATEAEPVGRRTRRVVTVLRADVVRSSGDELDPELLEALDRHALDVVRRAVERHGGTIERTDQAGITTVFGLTVAREDDALRAVRAAAELRGDAAETVAFRVGVATGEVVAGPRDTDGSVAIGAPVQMGARLAARAAPNEVLLTAETERLVRGATSTERARAGRGDDATLSSALRLIAVSHGDAIERRTTTPFVGRAVELEGLLAAFERAISDGMPGLATVIGAAGVGKSRLVAEAFDQIAERATILRSRCLPYGDGITYWPVRELVLAAAGIGPGELRDVALTKLDAVLAESDRADLVSSGVASIVGLSEKPVPTEEIRWSVRRFFEALAAERPLVLLVDDLQWAEPVLVELLEHVLDLGRGSLLLITIARPELEELRPDWLARSGRSLTRLEALNEMDAATLLDQLAPELAPGHPRSRILAAAEGNPLFVEQFVAYLSDEAGAAGMLDERTAADIPIPPTIGALLAARLDRLPDAERRLLERAAVIGRTFWTGALAELLPELERAELPRRLARLARRELIRPERSDFPNDEAYRFRHLLIRDAAYASMPKRERAELHVRFADWLEGRSGTDPGAYDLILAYHLEQAYRYRVELGHDLAGTRLLADRALTLIAPAGLAAEERGDPHAAVSLLTRAVDLAPTGGRRIELLIVLRAALRTAGEQAASNAADAETRAMLAQYPDEGLEYRRWLADAWFHGLGTIAEAEAAYTYFEGVDDATGMIRALELAINLHQIEGRFTTSLELLDQAMALAFEIGRPDRAATLFTSSAFSLTDGPIPVPDALVRLRRYLESAGNNRSAHGVILMCRGNLEAMTGDGDQWRRHFDAAKAIFDDIGLLDPFEVFMYPAFLGRTEVEIGEPGRVVEMLQTSCSTLDGLGDRTGGLAFMAPLTAQALLAVGRFDDAERYAYWGRDSAEPDDVEAQVRWRIAISGVRSVQVRHDEAITLAREAVAHTVGTEYAVLKKEAAFGLAGALRASGDDAGALAAALEAQRLATAKQDQAALRKIGAFLGSDGQSPR